MRNVLRSPRLALAALVACAACDNERATSYQPTHLDPQYAFFEELQDTAKYLPYGVPVPPGTVLTRPPQPYTPRLHGPPMSNSIPEQPASDNVPSPRRHDRRTPFPGTGDAGFTGFNLAGFIVRNDAQRDLVIPSSINHNVFVYAPTHKPHGQSCIEMVTSHEKAGSTATKHYSKFYDFCSGPTYRAKEEMTSAWANKYIRFYGVGCGTGCTVVPEEAYYNQVSADDPANPATSCWRGFLYNFNTGLWEQKIFSCPPQIQSWTYGWTMYETWYLQEYSLCPTLPSVQAQWIRKLTPAGTWVEVEPQEMLPFYSPGAYCFENQIWNVVQPTGPYYWKALTPN